MHIPTLFSLEHLKYSEKYALFGQDNQALGRVNSKCMTSQEKFFSLKDGIIFEWIEKVLPNGDT
ncbi:hypothetical protein AVO42_01445 [Thiomicrospira sp. XS5]|nr:hypothetical protein AVO42_01445 [Thiomicrospira sp. XS5]